MISVGEARIIHLIRKSKDPVKAMQVALDSLTNFVAQVCPGAIIELGGKQHDRSQKTDEDYQQND